MKRGVAIPISREIKVNHLIYTINILDLILLVYIIR
jgi:hypothetical protein